MNVLRDKKFNIDELNLDYMGKFQKYALSKVQTKDDLRYLLKLSGGLTNRLKFISDNLHNICNIIEDNTWTVLGLKCGGINLQLDNPKKSDNLDDILTNYSKIRNYLYKYKNYQIIEIESLFDNLVNFYETQNLNDFVKLANFIQYIKQPNKKIETFYTKLHNKGIKLIQNNQLSIEQIVTFIVSQDIYYYKPSYNSNYTQRDGSIMKYIPITDVDPNYKNNIQLLKDNNICRLFLNSHFYVKKQFIDSILEQIKKVRDFQSIFELFNPREIDRDVITGINNKMKEIKYNILDEKEEDYEIIFDVFDNWLIYIDNNFMNLETALQDIELNYNLTSKYFYHLFRKEKMVKYQNKLRESIIKFFMAQNKEGNDNEESLITLLLVSKYNLHTCVYILNQLNKRILTEQEFYRKDETPNFRLFRLFFEKCQELMENQEVIKGEYLEQSIIIRQKLCQDLNNFRVRYDTISPLINDKSFKEKMSVLFENNNEQIYNNLKNKFDICKNKFEELEKIENYYVTFFSQSKKKQINILKRILQNNKRKKINEILDNDNFFQDNEDFNFNNALEESKNLKYKDSILKQKSLSLILNILRIF